jgi:hypothetical protein
MYMQCILNRLQKIANYLDTICIILYYHPIEVEGLLLVRSWLPSFRPTPIETIEVQIL